MERRVLIPQSRVDTHATLREKVLAILGGLRLSGFLLLLLYLAFGFLRWLG
jgi:hypothetical protein